ncbi:hypothetical protein FOXG_21572 [Fusarium oxysporum f. sp. lycopersici 4287]|uniref:Aminoglycoside phosphotransferase domain-containing protein n=1 Tax=Fusarium oxysporum f. sp. lycopersici (strain 4287 / CBS 123668 / FGSC 9935 / NRRL 34936) TaxID=426428 RepID=A0A0J9VYJ3_FUSO4|nr:hypothetical protein FOXG_21572 [Fusarium oxysporum f. sp. lycopersici 4287]KNB16059.1 hypothetical protein FOXG_21572 [Fusarium oxysporum f. sp. lycopersici 4287]
MPSSADKILNKHVQNVEVIERIHRTASKISIKLTFENDTDDGASSVCVKGGFNTDNRESLPFLYAIYRLEAEFYYYLAPRLKIPLPPVSYAGTDTVNGHGIVVMNDLKAQGYTFGSPLETWPVERARMSAEQLATLHASTWGDTGEGIPSVSKTVSIRDAVVGLVAPEEWDKRFAPGARRPVPKFMEDRERMTAAFQGSLGIRLQNEVHRFMGDAHIGNTVHITHWKNWLLLIGLVISAAFSLWLDVLTSLAGPMLNSRSPALHEKRSLAVLPQGR